MTSPDGPDEREGYYRGFPPAGGAGALDRPAHTSVSRWTAVVLVLVVVAVTAAALANLIAVDKVVYRPGPVYSTLSEVNGRPIISIEGTETYPTSGRLDFTTIRVFGGPRSEVTAWDWWMAELDPASDVFPEEAIYPPDVTAQQVQEQNTALMQSSQQSAAVAALRAAGEEVGEDVLVAQVITDAPAAGVLRVDDHVVAVEDQPVGNPEDVRDYLQEHEPGAEVTFQVVRDGEEVTLEVPTGPGDDSADPRTIIGVYLASDFDLPYEVEIDAGNVGGSSAGLMFALAIYDAITPGELTGGEGFAGTGEISSSGEVGPIGGIRQKMVAAERAGLDYFLAPRANCDQVTGAVPSGLTAIPVQTFDEARDLVEEVGSGEQTELPTC